MNQMPTGLNKPQTPAVEGAVIDAPNQFEKKESRLINKVAAEFGFTWVNTSSQPQDNLVRPDRPNDAMEPKSTNSNYGYRIPTIQELRSKIEAYSKLLKVSEFTDLEDCELVINSGGDVYVHDHHSSGGTIYRLSENGDIDITFNSVTGVGKTLEEATQDLKVKTNTMYDSMGV